MWRHRLALWNLSATHCATCIKTTPKKCLNKAARGTRNYNYTLYKKTYILFTIFSAECSLKRFFSETSNTTKTPYGQSRKCKKTSKMPFDKQKKANFYFL